MLHQLKDLGVSIAMDDFGTGHSSLGYLRSFYLTRLRSISPSFETCPRARIVWQLFAQLLALAEVSEWSRPLKVSKRRFSLRF